VAGRQGFGDEVRLVAGIELVPQILDMAFDRPRGDAELLRTLFGREALGNALQDLPLAVGQAHEVFLLTRKIHHASPLVGKTTTLPIGFVITPSQTTERAVPDLDRLVPRSAVNDKSRFKLTEFVTAPYRVILAVSGPFRTYAWVNTPSSYYR
jgi:hypothetical protein